MLSFKTFLDSDNKIIDLYLAKETITEIKKKTGKSIGEIYRSLHNNKIYPNRLNRNYYNVVDYASNGSPVSEIAKLTGYSQRNVRYILTKLNYVS